MLVSETVLWLQPVPLDKIDVEHGDLLFGAQFLARVSDLLDVLCFRVNRRVSYGW